jgi:hypothetical protein
MATRLDEQDHGARGPRPRPGITYELVLHRPEDLGTVAAWAAGIGVEILFGRGTRLRVRTTLAHVRALTELTAVALVVAWIPAQVREPPARRRAAGGLEELLDA